MEARARRDEEFFPEAFGLREALNPIGLITDADHRRCHRSFDALLPQIGAPGQRRILAEEAKHQIDATTINSRKSRDATDDDCG
ncbi:hypothetical protein D9M72_611730 [compost metagenome]